MKKIINYIWILEGSTSEPTYLELFSKTYNIQINIRAKGVGHKLDNINNAIKNVKKNQRNAKIIVVFDVDSSRDDASEYQRIVNILNNNPNECYNLADYYLISNRQFEVWLWWHFNEGLPEFMAERPSKEEKTKLNAKIKEFEENIHSTEYKHQFREHFNNACKRTKAYNTEFKSDLPFSTCYRLEEIFSSQIADIDQKN